LPAGPPLLRAKGTAVNLFGTV